MLGAANQEDPQHIFLYCVSSKFLVMYTFVTTGATGISRNMCSSGLRKGMRIGRGKKRYTYLDIDAFLRREKT